MKQSSRYVVLMWYKNAREYTFFRGVLPTLLKIAVQMDYTNMKVCTNFTSNNVFNKQHAGSSRLAEGGSSNQTVNGCKFFNPN